MAQKPLPNYRRRRRIVGGSLILFLSLALLFVASTIDIRRFDGRALRGIYLSGSDVSGLDAEGLQDKLDHLDELVANAPVYIETPDAAYQINAERLGLRVDRTATTAAVLTAGRNTNSLLRPWYWVNSFFSTNKVDAVMQLDADAAEPGLAAVSKTISIEPGAPNMVLENGRLVLKAGKAGSILDVERLLKDLSLSLPNQPGDAISVKAYTRDDETIDVAIQALVDRLNGSSTEPILFLTSRGLISVEPEVFRAWLRLDTTAATPRAFLDLNALQKHIDNELEIAQGVIDTRALIVEGDQVKVAAKNALRCCTAESSAAVLASVLKGTSPIQIELIKDPQVPLIELGIGELIGEFTTNFEAGKARTTNIKRMADLVKGAIIEPSQTFSLNNFVGPRTVEAGFVPAPVIYDGVYDEDVGGGVSQFATTLFNAAFFAGLELTHYQAHSLYIERYPYGREATIDYPDVDLKITNQSPNPVLIWTQHTQDSITVKLFGTRFVEAEQSDQTVVSLGSCERVRTTRTRTWPDGSTTTDYVWATYQPEVGIGCDGQPTKAPPECGEGELLVDTTNDGLGDSCAIANALCPADALAADTDGDGVIDSCNLQEAICPQGTSAEDSDGDGNPDICVTTP